MSRRVLDCRRLGFDGIADEEFLEFLGYKFSAIVVSAFRGSRVATEPLFVKLCGAAFGICCGDERKFEPSASGVHH